MDTGIFYCFGPQCSEPGKKEWLQAWWGEGKGEKGRQGCTGAGGGGSTAKPSLRYVWLDSETLEQQTGPSGGGLRLLSSNTPPSELVGFLSRKRQPCALYCSVLCVSTQPCAQTRGVNSHITGPHALPQALQAWPLTFASIAQSMSLLLIKPCPLGPYDLDGNGCSSTRGSVSQPGNFAAPSPPSLGSPPARGLWVPHVGSNMSMSRLPRDPVAPSTRTLSAEQVLNPSALAQF